MQGYTEPTKTNKFQQMVIQGKGFYFVQNFITTSGTAELDFLLMRNPAASGKTIYGQMMNYTYTKGSGVSIARIYGSPTITANGTAQTIQKLKPSSSIATIANLYYAPTITARGTLTALFGQGATGTYTFMPNLTFMLEENQDMLFTVTPAGNNTDHQLSIYWGEE